MTQCLSSFKHTSFIRLWGVFHCMYKWYIHDYVCLALPDQELWNGHMQLDSWNQFEGTVIEMRYYTQLQNFPDHIETCYIILPLIFHFSFRDLYRLFFSPQLLDAYPLEDELIILLSLIHWISFKRYKCRLQSFNLQFTTI